MFLSKVPTITPSVVLSYVPSRATSKLPTHQHSITPTLMPSNGPSKDPFSDPSHYPDSLPSLTPAFDPSSGPSLAQTTQPTDILPGNLSFNPTYNSSNFPSLDPTFSAIYVPSSLPSFIVAVQHQPPQLHQQPDFRGHCALQPVVVPFHVEHAVDGIGCHPRPAALVDMDAGPRGTRPAAVVQEGERKALCDSGA